MKDALGDVPFEDLQLSLFAAPQMRSRPPNGVPPDLAFLFENIALDLIRRRGMKRYSARAILHRIRWFHHVERGDADWKCNNNHTAKLARWFMTRHPEHDGFFETRERADG